MKIREDFVTNSSSTSFIISMKEDFNEKNFMRDIGIKGKTPMSKIFKDLYDAVDGEKTEIHEYLRGHKEDFDTVGDFLRDEGYDSETISIVEALIDQKRTVYYGNLKSDGESAAEVYFCMESFLVCEDDIYFNGKIGGW